MSSQSAVAEDVHVIPVNDHIGHSFDDCVCGPAYELVKTEWGDRYVVTHHSLDGRELHEAVQPGEEWRS